MPDDASAPPGRSPPADGFQCSLVATARGTPPLDAAELIALILTRYHETHRREFPQAIQLAREVEAAHAGEAACPRGLADHLLFMADDLESHQLREEQVLFPMILAGGGPMVKFPIGRMMQEHEEVAEQLEQLRALTNQHQAPAGACDAWRALARACRKLDEDLCEHMRLENEVLFARFLT